MKKKTSLNYKVIDMKMRFVLVCISLMFALSAMAQEEETTDTLSQALQEVMVVGDKINIKVEDGKIAVDLPSIVKDKPVTNIYDALTYLPGVNTDSSGSLALAGASGMTILLNGKVPQMSAENLVALLRSYPIERLKGVEIMYSTPAKYHVNGASINIILKTPSVLDGLQGQVSADYGQQHYAGGGAGVALTYATEKLTADVMYNYSLGKSWSNELITSNHSYNNTVENIVQNEKTTNNGQNHNGHIGFDWKLTPKNKISVAYNFQVSPVKYVQNISDGSLGLFTTYGDYPSSKKFHNLSIDYESSFGLNLGGSYTYYGEARATSLTDNNSMTVLQDFTSQQKINQGHFYADQSHKIGKMRLNYGASFDYSNDYSSQYYINSEGDDFASRLKEYSGDLYLGVEGSVSSAFSLSASLKGDYYHRGDETKWWVAPQLAMTFMKNYNHIFQLNVSSMKNYPSYWEIHGGKTWVNNYMVVVGNPDLRPSYTYQGQAVYILKQKYVAVLYYNYADNYSVQLPYQSPDALNLIYQTKNYNYDQRLGLMLRVPFKAGEVLSSTLTLNGYYDHIKSDDFYDISFNREKCTLYADLDNSIKLLKKQQLYLTVTASVITSSLQGIADMSSLWKFDVGAKWTFLKGNADLIVKGNDIFNKWSPTMTINRYGQDFKMDIHEFMRSFGVTFAYRFKGFQPKSFDVDKSRYGLGK